MEKFNLVRLEAPAFDNACRKQAADGGNRKGVYAASNLQIAYGVNATFAAEALEIIELLEKATFPIEEINKTPAHMNDKKADAAAAVANRLPERKG